MSTKVQKSNEIFQRIEKKYLLSREQYNGLRERMQGYMEVDEFGLHTICNIYYDTEDYELIRKSNEKPSYKEKLRLRSYGIPGQEDRTFIEIKKKYDGIVYKRRVQLPLKESMAYLDQGQAPDKDTQILKEIDYFLKFYQPVKKMYLAYDRIAMFCVEDDSIRITFDQNIRNRLDDLDLSQGDHGNVLFSEGEVLMEIKVAGAYPLWLVDMLSELKIYPTSFSKYGTFYKKLVVEQREQVDSGYAVYGRQPETTHKRENEHYSPNNREENVCLPA